MPKIGWIAFGAVVSILLVGIVIRIGDWISFRKERRDGLAANGNFGDFAVVSEGRPGPDPAEIFSGDDMVRLGRVILKGDGGGIRKALAGGAAVNGKGSYGLTPLHLSLLSLQIESFRTLLSEGANPNLPADNGDAAMSLVALMPEPSWLELAIESGGDADFPDRRGRTPLMIAARHGRVENVRLLVSKGASLDAIDRHGETALIHTFQAFEPNLAIARFLIATGADPEKANVAGFKARDFAETYGDAGYLTVFPSP